MTDRLDTIQETWDTIDTAFRSREVKEYASYKDVPWSENIFWLDAPDLIGGLIERGTLKMEDMEQANIDYKDFVFYLTKEWPDARLKEHVLEQKRQQWARAAKYIQDLELKNRDARVAGVGYKERDEKYGKKIKVGHRVLEEYKREGQELKKKEFSVASLVRPSDMQTIQKDGFEKYLYFTLCFGYPQEG